MKQGQFGLLKTQRFAPFFLTQIFGAFNDNLFKQALLILIAFRLPGLLQADVDYWANLASGLFILPFFLFSANAGQWAEKFEKSALIRLIKLAEIGIMALAALGFYLNSLPLLLAVLFLMGAQSAFFGPIKYAILPQVLLPEELIGGNALVESGTFLAILTGTLFGGWMMASFVSGPALASIVLLLIACAGYLASRRITPLSAAAPDLKLDWNPISASWHTLRCLRGNRTVFNSVLGISWFWFFGAMYIAQLPNYTRYVLGGDESVATLVLALFSIGIASGSLLCERFSHRTVEIGLVPFGAIGLTVFGVDLFLARSTAGPELALTAWSFIEIAGSVRVMFDLFMIGVFGGFYIVPLFALVQQRSAPERLARIIAANNILNALFMVLAAIMAIGLLHYAGLSLPHLLLLTAVLNAVVAIYIFSLVPEFFMRFVVWCLVRILYRIDARGIEEHIPDHGPAIIVCNHVSYMDALLIGGLVPRPVRFVMYYKIFKIPVLSWVFRTAGAIPIASARENPEMLREAFEKIDAALAAGEIVGVFPEGALTRDGEIATFKTGIERMIAQRPVPVVPMALRGMWQSLFSRSHEQPRWLRWPRRIRARIGVWAGPEIAPECVSAARLESEVRSLRADAA